MYDLRGVCYCYNIQYLLISLIFILMIRTSPFSRCTFKRQKSKLKSQDFSALGEQLQLRICDYFVDMVYWLDNNRSIFESMKNRINRLLFLCAFLYGLKIRFIFDIAIDINILETIFASDSFLSHLRTCLVYSCGWQRGKHKMNVYYLDSCFPFSGLLRSCIFCECGFRHVS